MMQDRSQQVKPDVPSENGDDPLPRLRADGQACLQAALEYLKLGWAVLPLCNPEHIAVKAHKCDQPGKVPVVKWKEHQDRPATEDEISHWWRSFPFSNVGVALGPVSGLIRVDIDGPAGEARLQALSQGDLPDTLEFTSGRANGGRGLLYAIPPNAPPLTTTPLAQGNKEELRLQARGAQTVLPPSRHPSGCCYAWREGHGPSDRKPALAPAWAIEQLRQGGRGRERNGRARTLADGERIEDGERDVTLASLAGSMRRRGMSEESMVAALLVENATRCDPPLEESTVRKIARSVARYEPEPRQPAEESAAHHKGNGQPASEGAPLPRRSHPPSPGK